MLGKIILMISTTFLNTTDGLWNKSDEDYCQMNTEHTMCQYTKFNSMKLQCREYEEFPQGTLAPWILNVHNTYRNKYANGSILMFTVPNELELEWDEELAAIAARWAWQCPYYEDEFRDVERFRVANSVVILSAKDVHHTPAAVWDNSLRDNETFHEAPSADTSGERTVLHSRFSLADRTSLITNPYFKYLGCASAKYLQQIGEEIQLRTIIVCNYGPLESPYPKIQPSGLPCTLCPENTSCSDERLIPDYPYKSLCFADRSEVQFSSETQDNLQSTSDRMISSRVPSTSKEIVQSSEDIVDSVEKAKDATPYGLDGESETPSDTTTYKHIARHPRNILDNFGEEVREQYLGLYENKSAPECKIVCDNGEEHTMCKYDNRSAEGYLVIPVSVGEIKEQALTEHNKFRNQFSGGFITEDSPLAANMREMVWNENLAEVAHRWAIQCSPEKDKCRDTFLYEDDKIPTYVSQLIGALKWNIKLEFPRFAQFFQEWKAGLEHLKKGNIDPYRNPKNGTAKDYANVAQLLWAETYQIGCSMALCSASHNLVSDDSTVITVCNYAPGGLIEGMSIFEKGGPCTKCRTLPTSDYGGMFCSKEFPFLCSGVSRLSWTVIIFSSTVLNYVKWQI